MDKHLQTVLNIIFCLSSIQIITQIRNYLIDKIFNRIKGEGEQTFTVKVDLAWRKPTVTFCITYTAIRMNDGQLSRPKPINFDSRMPNWSSEKMNQEPELGGPPWSDYVIRISCQEIHHFCFTSRTLNSFEKSSCWVFRSVSQTLTFLRPRWTVLMIDDKIRLNRIRCI